MKLNVISKQKHAGKSGKYEKDYMKTKFNSDDDLPLKNTKAS